jgi:hypothetical protein
MKQLGGAGYQPLSEYNILLLSSAELKILTFKRSNTVLERLRILDTFYLPTNHFREVHFIKVDSRVDRTNGR